MPRLQRAILLLLLLVTVGLATLAVRSSQPSHTPEKPESSGKPGNEQTKKEPPESIWHPSSYEAITGFTALLVLLTSVLSGTAIVQIRFLVRADNAAKISSNLAREALDHSREVFQATERPWISVKGKGGGLAFKDEGFDITVNFRLKNIGKAPATKVFLDPQVHIVEKGNMEAQDVRETQKTLIDEAKKRVMNVGYSVFPSVTMRVDHTVAVSKAELPPGFDVSKPLLLVFFGCVIYRPVGDSRVHHTGFMFGVGRDRRTLTADYAIKGRTPGVIYPDEGDVSPGNLTLNELFWGWTAD